MPRRTRIHIDGLPLPIVQRGHNRAACFFDDQDRRAYLGWMHEALVRERCRMCLTDAPARPLAGQPPLTRAAGQQASGCA
jgi:hypothetical protein